MRKINKLQLVLK